MSIKTWFKNLGLKLNPPLDPIDVGRIEVEFQLADGLTASEIIEGFAFEGIYGVPWVTSARNRLEYWLQTEKFLNVTLLDAHHPNGRTCAVNVNTIKSYRILKEEQHLVVPSK